MSRVIKFRAFDPVLKMRPVVDVAGDGSWWRVRIDDGICTLNNGSLMQFTGLLDKNGVEIYEGDVLEVTDSSGFVKRKSVSHSIDHEQNYRADRNLPGREAFLSAWGMQDAQGGFEAFIHINRPCDYAAVIGNIHENPELLKTAEGGEE